MNFALWLSNYLSLNILLAISALVGLGIFYFNQRSAFLKYSIELKLNYFLLTLPAFLVMVRFLLPVRSFFEPFAKVWVSGSIHDFPKTYSQNLRHGLLSFSPASAPLDIERVVGVSAILIGGALVVWGGLFLLDLIRLKRILRSSYAFKKIGPVRVDFNPRTVVPFSYWLPGRAGAVLPESMVLDPQARKISLAHEIQHHRQRDTQWIYFIWLYRVICFWNPAVYLWGRVISEIQEFSCDEALLDRRKVSSKEYAACLLQVAQLARRQERGLVCATGMTFLTHESLLKRRIKEMFNRKHKGSVGAWGLSFCALTLLACAAMASNNLIQDRRVTLSEAEVWAQHAQSSEFPVVVNDLVLKQLNRYLGTPDGREFIRESLSRMEGYRDLISKKLAHYGLPEELLAVPITESGYQNLTQSPITTHGAGLWMFIRKTAQNYGLRVDGDVDERLNVDLETDAAMRLLGADKLQFGDWLLTILAYNVGENGVADGIQNTGSRDAWTLVRSGVSNDRDYLARLMAAVIIMKNPSILN